MARIYIRGLKVFGHHGAYEHERKQGQFFIVDLQLHLDKIPEQDELVNTVDYVEVIQVIESISKRETFNLIETFAQAIGKQLLDKFGTVDAVDVRVRKRLWRADADLDWVAASVKVLREKDIRRE